MSSGVPEGVSTKWTPETVDQTWKTFMKTSQVTTTWNTLRPLSLTPAYKNSRCDSRSATPPGRSLCLVMKRSRIQGHTQWLSLLPRITTAGEGRYLWFPQFLRKPNVLRAKRCSSEWGSGVLPLQVSFHFSSLTSFEYVVCAGSTWPNSQCFLESLQLVLSREIEAWLSRQWQNFRRSYYKVFFIY